MTQQGRKNPQDSEPEKTARTYNEAPREMVFRRLPRNPPLKCKKPKPDPKHTQTRRPGQPPKDHHHWDRNQPIATPCQTLETQRSLPMDIRGTLESGPRVLPVAKKQLMRWAIFRLAPWNSGEDDRRISRVGCLLLVSISPLLLCAQSPFSQGTHVRNSSHIHRMSMSTFIFCVLLVLRCTKVFNFANHLTGNNCWIHPKTISVRLWPPYRPSLMSLSRPCLCLRSRLRCWLFFMEMHVNINATENANSNHKRHQTPLHPATIICRASPSFRCHFQCA